MIRTSQSGQRFELHSPTELPRACGFLWNRQMMIQMNCRGFAVAQFMQPEPAKYTYAPNLEAKTFMQPEQPYYAHHPGRFFYVKDEVSGELFSAPHEPVRAAADRYVFSVGKSDIRWQVSLAGIRLELCLTLSDRDAVELWQVSVVNDSGQERSLSLYPYIPFGQMSWMNQSALYRPDLGAIVAKYVTPYQKVEEYFKHKDFKELTYFLYDRAPDSFETIREHFEGEGGLHNPDALRNLHLEGGEALHESPVAALQYRLTLAPGEQQDFRFLLGPAKDDAEIESIARRYLTDDGFATARSRYQAYLDEGQGTLEIDTPDRHLNDVVNHWLPRQVFYHGDVNRLCTDPQTRNYLQDAMGMVYIQPERTREAIAFALSQQEPSGALPDGIRLLPDVELKYINRIPHTDHCVWLPIALQAYLNETNDIEFLRADIRQWQGTESMTVFDRMTAAMRWLQDARDERGLSYIAQGDWCDPMNMVGYQGKGVSVWLSVATAYALQLWANICLMLGERDVARECLAGAGEINDAVNRHCWDGQWYGRGITDAGVLFGISGDTEGRIFLNPQSWALLAGTCNGRQRRQMIAAIAEQLETPYGVMMFAPAYTAMREDVGRVTQKHPGSGENGSVYNHAAAFYIYSLFEEGESDRAFRLLRQMIPGESEADYRQRGQLPVYIPNYYRGAYYQFPRTAGRSSQLFNTGTVAWVYRSVVEQLFGLQGTPEGLCIAPQLPSHWKTARAVRRFRGAEFVVQYHLESTEEGIKVCVDGQRLEGTVISDFSVGQRYHVDVYVGLDA